METREMHKSHTSEECERLATERHLKTDDALNTEIGTSNNIQGNQEAPLIKNNESQKGLIKNTVSPETQTIVLESDVSNEKNESPNITNKSDTTTPGDSPGYNSENQKRYEEFSPKLKEILEQFSTKQYTPVEVQTKVKERSPHTFLSVIDTVLVIMESTLAGAYYILQNYHEPRIPLEICNTMNSVRLAIETLKDHYSYTQEKHYEPISSILRELMSPSIELFQKIYPDLKIPNLEYYNVFNDTEECPTSPTPQDQNFRPDYLVIPRNENGTTMFDPYPLEPRIAPRIPLFNTNKDPTLGILATGDGFIRLLLPCTFQIDFTIDQAIFVKNLKDKTVAAISACGTFSGLQTELCRVYHHGKTVDIFIKDSYNNKNMFAKMNDRGIYLGGTGALSNVQLKENGDIVTTDTAFQDLDDDFIKNIFLSNSVYGPEYYDICTDSLESVNKKVFVDGSVHLTWKDIKIKQYKTGEIVIGRNDWNFFIWCCPEVSSSVKGFGKKGLIKVVTPMNRIVSTIINIYNKQKEKYLLVNTKKHWVYYTNREFIMSNEIFSAGYNDALKNEDDV